MIIQIPQGRQEGVTFNYPESEQKLNKSFISLILGPSGSGKSSLIQQLVINQHFYGGCFDAVVFVGKNSYQNIQISEQNSIERADPVIIRDAIQELNKKNDLQNYNLLLILDDVISQIRSDRNNLWKPLFLNRRHQINNGTISYIISSQKFSLVPTWLRSGITETFLFKTNGYQARSYVNWFGLREDQKKMQDRIISLPCHGFIYHNVLKNKLYNNKFEDLNSPCLLNLTGRMKRQQQTLSLVSSPSFTQQQPIQHLQKPKQQTNISRPTISDQLIQVPYKMTEEEIKNRVIKEKTSENMINEY